MINLLSIEAVLNTFTAIGCLVVLIITLKVFTRLRRFIKGHFTSATVDFKKLGKYAVVTGATDGIGKAYAFELARYGMDIVLISRTPAKLDATAEEIQSKYPKADVRTIVADFEQTDIYDRIERELGDIDVGVLVNNVGALIEPLATLWEMSREDIMRSFNINMVSTIQTAHIVVSQMAAKRQGLIINLSSISAYLPPVYSLYSCSKAFTRRFSYALRVQCEPLGIIVQDVSPSFVTTNMTHNKSNYMSVMPETCARQALKTVGHYDETHGAVRHDVFGFIMSLFPEKVMLRQLINYNKKLVNILGSKKE